MLKNCLLASAMALSVYALSESAEAGQRPQGWYVGVEGGMTWVQDADILSTALPPRTIDADFDRDIALIGEVGYSWDNNWRLAFELGLRDNDVDCLSINSAPCTASVLHSVLSATQMVNVVHDIELNDRTFVSLGFGIGGAYVDADGPGLVEDHDYVFAAQALLQLTQPVTQGVDVVVSKFRGLAGPKGMPDELAAQWEQALRAALASEAYRREYARESLIPVMMGRAEARAFTQRFVGEVTATLRELGVIR